jgi:hypothetical protein
MKAIYALFLFALSFLFFGCIQPPISPSAVPEPKQFVSLNWPILTPLCNRGVCYVENSGVCPSGYIYQHHPVNGDSCRLVCTDGKIYSFDPSGENRPSDFAIGPCYCKYGFEEVKADQFVCARYPMPTPIPCKKEGETLANTNPVMQNALDNCCGNLAAVTCPPDEKDALKRTQPVCTNCGNGICGLGETTCNCPQDCQGGGPSPSDCKVYCGELNPVPACEGYWNVTPISIPYRGAEHCRCEWLCNADANNCTKEGNSFPTGLMPHAGPKICCAG